MHSTQHIVSTKKLSIIYDYIKSSAEKLFISITIIVYNINMQNTIEKIISKQLQFQFKWNHFYLHIIAPMISANLEIRSGNIDNCSLHLSAFLYSQQNNALTYNIYSILGNLNRYKHENVFIFRENCYLVIYIEKQIHTLNVAS